MAFEQQGIDYPYIGSTNVTALSWTGNPPAYSSGGIPQYTVVTVDTGDGTEGAVKVCTSTTALPIGVAQDAPAVTAGQAVNVRVSGVSKARAGGAVSIGDLLMVDGSGRVVTATAAGASNFFLVGQAETAATQAEDIISVRLLPGGTQYVAS